MTEKTPQTPLDAAEQAELERWKTRKAATDKTLQDALRLHAEMLAELSDHHGALWDKWLGARGLSRHDGTGYTIASDPDTGASIIVEISKQPAAEA